MGFLRWIKKEHDARLSPTLLKIKKELQRKQRIKSSLPNWNSLSRHEKQLVDEIILQTAAINQNNITRTMSYLEFYCKYPEIHWAFLAHMVSRNAGWNMTDLKGELLSRLLTEQEQLNFFLLLERGNWLIFQDAYPQLLLYEKSLKYRSNLFYLLPYLGVSCFMEVIWNYFWTARDVTTLTTALIINEQSYLEKRVIHNSVYQKTVMNTVEFKLQDLLSMNQILFPYEPISKTTNFPTTPLLGATLHHFASLPDRIVFGKRLYSLLFYDPQRLVQSENWALMHRHTGSRKDFWPQLFNQVRETAPGAVYERRIEDCKIKPKARRLYSPILRHAWKDTRHLAAEPGDWYQNERILHHFQAHEIVNEDIQTSYCKTLERIELAIVAREFLLGSKRQFEEE